MLFKKRISMSYELYSILFMLYNLLAFNMVFFEKIAATGMGTGFNIGTFLVIWTLGSLACLLLFWPLTVKPLSYLFLLINSSVFYFVKTYNISIDREMLVNVLQTNPVETFDLLNLTWFSYILILGVVPSLIVRQIDFAPVRFWKRRFEVMQILLLFLGPAITNLKVVAPFVRSHKPLKYQLIPVNYIGAITSLTKKYYRQNHKFTQIGLDSHFTKYWQNDKKNLFIFIVGETARADNFSFNGYNRNTNAPLDNFKNNIINYPHATSCGTSTAVSLPCMFSKDARHEFVSGSMAYTENLLDIMQRNGYHVTWVENNSDCKNLCARVETLYPCGIHPQEKECLDDILLPEIDKSIPQSPQNTIVVLHQVGSHGPKYFKRYTKAEYEPACNTEKLNECTHEELINAYDNTIYYTSQNIADIIEKTKQYEKNYNTMVFYVSDHGESLGENNLYLHSTPYIVAPKEQINIPFFFWTEEKTLEVLQLDKTCLENHAKENISHDNIFHSLLGISGIKAAEYQQDLDLFAKCKK